MDLTQEYLTCYAQLSQPALSKQANRRLLELEASAQAWNIAHTLLASHDPQLLPHGCQLLSKKLNAPPPPEIDLPSLLTFLLSLPHRNSVLHLCVAKLMLHASPSKPLSLDGLPEEMRLKVLREMASAISQVRTEPSLENNVMKEGYMQAALPLLVGSFDTQSDEVLGCLDAFVSQNTKIKSEQIVLKLLELPLSDASVILEEIFLHEKYPQLAPQIQNYLSRNMQEDEALSLHLAYYSNASMASLSQLEFTNLLGFITHRLTDPATSLLDTYDFWVRLHGEAEHHGLPPTFLPLIRQAFLFLWRLVSSRSLLVQLPSNAVVSVSALSIDVDDDEAPAMEVDPNQHVLYFRNSGSDFIQICLESLEGTLELNELMENVAQLCRGSPLELELGIYHLVSFTEGFIKWEDGARPAVELVFTREGEYNEFLCGKVIDLVGKLHGFLQIHCDLQTAALAFLARTLTYQTLSPLASESCCELLEEAKPRNGQQSNIQAFLSHIYQVLFIGGLSERVVENLTKAMVIFIFKFKGSPDYYRVFLETLNTRMEQSQQERKAKHIEAAILAQLWLNARSEGKSYLLVFEQFLRNQINFFFENIQSAQRKPKLTEAVNLLNLALKTNAVTDVQPWVTLTAQILQRYLPARPPLPIVITPILNLSRLALQSENQGLIADVVVGMGQWEQPISQLLEESEGKVEFNVSNVVLQFHIGLARLFLIDSRYFALTKYSPQTILNFITKAVTAEAWQYQLLKNCLSYWLLALQLGFPAEPILLQLFTHYAKFSDTLWNSVEPILFAVYRQHGSAPLANALKAVKSRLDNENALWGAMEQALAGSEGKTVKNLLLTLT